MLSLEVYIIYKWIQTTASWGALEPTSYVA